MKSSQSFSIVVLSSLLAVPALAAEVSFTPLGDANAGSLKGEAPLTVLGALPLKNGSALINDKVVAIKTAGDFSETPRTVLAGSVLRTEAISTGLNSSLTGLVVFLMGEWLQQVDDPAAPDVIFRNDGQVRGRIIGREGDRLVLQMPDGSCRQLPLSTMLYIRSPRVFVFSIQAKSKAAVEKDSPFSAEVVSATFRPTATPRSVSLGSVVPHSQEEESSSLGLSPLSPVRMSPAQLFDQDELPGAAKGNRFLGPPSWVPQ